MALHLSIGILKKAAIVAGVLLALSAFLFLLDGYYVRSAYGSPISGSGTIEYISYSGDSAWYIISDNGHQVYRISADSIWGDPSPNSFYVRGLKVYFTGYLHDTIAHSYTCEYYEHYSPWDTCITLTDIYIVSRGCLVGPD